ncbi:metalloregulator ArsR/SmtB family transcription factor [Devosia sp.]|uniref:ArsR/SmtB family transcription factor n=1 Tax=Devosia sp. TaxID=1871048 RepID=UPI003BA8A015
MSPVDQFAALADPTRLRVIELLSAKSRPVHELAAAFSISRPAISRHLKVLKEADLVKEEKRGRENVYALQRSRLKPAMDWLEKHRAKPDKPEKTPKRAPVNVVPAVANAPAVIPEAIAPLPKLAPKLARKLAPAPVPQAASAPPQLSFDL